MNIENQNVYSLLDKQIKEINQLKKMLAIYKTQSIAAMKATRLGLCKKAISRALELEAGLGLENTAGTRNEIQS